MKSHIVAGTLRRGMLVVLLGFTLLPVGVSLLLLSAEVARYGPPSGLLLSICVVVAVVAGYRYAIRRKGGKTPEWHTSWTIAALVIAAVFLITNQLILRGLAVGLWDAEGELFPFQVLVADFARSGRFVQWDPWSDGGLALASDPSVGAFSPLNVVVGLLTGGTSFGFRVYWLLVWLLGGLGVLMLARQLKTPAWGGAVVAIGFLFSGFYTGNAEHTSVIVAFSYLPLIIWRLNQALMSRKMRPAAEAGVLWGLSALSGYPGVTVSTGLFCGLWVIGFLTLPESPAQDSEFAEEAKRDLPSFLSRLGTSFVAVAIFVVVGIAVMSPTYYRFFLEGAGTTGRAEPLSRETAVLSNTLEPGALSTFSSPYLAALKADNQLHGDGELWPGTDLSMSSIYAGAPITILALFSILVRPRDRWRWLLVILGGLCLACALGSSLPLRGWLYDWVYPFRFFRHSALFGSYFMMAISILALIGIRELSSVTNGSASSPKQLTIASVVCAIASLSVFLAVVLYFGAQSKMGVALAIGTWLIVSGGWFAILGLSGLLRLLGSSMTRSIPVLLILIASSEAFLASAVSRAHVASTEAHDIARWQSLDQYHSLTVDLTANGLMRDESACLSSSNNNPPRLRDSPNPPVACDRSDQLITKVPVLQSYSTLTNSFHLRFASNPILKETAIGTERIWFCNEAARVPAVEENFSAFVKRSETLRAPPLVIHSPEDLIEPTESRSADLARIEQLPACSRIPVRLVKYDPEELIFDCNPSEDGWLFVTDRWGPGWRAEVNGQSTDVYAGNFIFRAVRVPAGETTVRFTYHPPGFPMLLILSWTTLGGTALWSLAATVRRTKSAKALHASKPADIGARG